MQSYNIKANDGLMQNCGISSTLALEIPQACKALGNYHDIAYSTALTNVGNGYNFEITKIPHSSPVKVSYGVFIVSILESERVKVPIQICAMKMW